MWTQLCNVFVSTERQCSFFTWVSHCLVTLLDVSSASCHVLLCNCYSLSLSFCTLLSLLLIVLCVCLLDIHTEAVQAALARHKEEKMALPMPTKRRSAFAQSPAEDCTPPGGSCIAHKPSASPSVQISLTSRVSENTGTPEPLGHTLAFTRENYNYIIMYSLVMF